METVEDSKSIWSNNTIYFLTDSTYIHFPYFKIEDQKQIVLNQFKKVKREIGAQISAYSIAMNHYHLMFYLKRGSDMQKVKQILRGGISYEYRKRYNVKYNEMWQTRKILYISSEKMNWKVLGYIIGNLLKHKEVSTYEELKQNEFSSCWHMANKYGDDITRDLIFSAIHAEEDSWNRVNISEFNKKKN